MGSLDLFGALHNCCFIEACRRHLLLKKKSFPAALYGIFPKEFNTWLMVLHVNDLTPIRFVLV